MNSYKRFEVDVSSVNTFKQSLESTDIYKNKELSEQRASMLGTAVNLN